MNSTPSIISRVADGVLEASIIGSFSRIGYQTRQRLADWDTYNDMTGKVVLVTGATSGLGEATATTLARLGATVHFLARNESRAELALERIQNASGSNLVSYGLADLSDLASVAEFAREVLEHHNRLDVLVHNAGALHREFARSPQGVEQTIASHVLAQFELTTMLLPILGQGSRVITVSSGGMYTQKLDLDHAEMSESEYDGVVAYARAKRIQVALNGAWAERHNRDGIMFSVMHPGWAATPGVDSSLPGFAKVMRSLLRTSAQGADTTIWLATANNIPQAEHGIWLDRKLRWEHKLPWTRSSNEHERAWSWCRQRLETSR